MIFRDAGLYAAELNPYPDGKLDLIEVGAYADLLIVDENPLVDLTVLRDYRQNLKVIMKEGFALNRYRSPDKLMRIGRGILG